MDIAEINDILSKAPSIISYRAELENKYYALMLTMHEKYKELRGLKYKELREKTMTIKDVDYALDCDNELVALKNEEINSEIEYRKFRTEKDRAVNKFEAAKNIGYNLRCEIKGLSDTIK